MDTGVKTFADYLAILKRRRIAILLIFIAVILPGVYITYALPTVYRSTATFLIEQQAISQDLVRTIVTGYADEQIQEVRQRVMSNANLQRLVEKYSLYGKESGGSITTAIELLKENVLFEPEIAEVVNERTGRSMLATITFDVSFEYTDPEITQQVTADLADLYLKENVDSRTNQVQATVDFIQDDIERHRANVEETSQALAAFREKHPGNLPDQHNFNLQAVDRMDRQIDGIDEDIRQARDRKLKLEGDLLRMNPYATATSEDGAPIMGTGLRLAELQRERLRLLSIYSPQHPDVRSVEREIRALSGGPASGNYIGDIEAQIAAARQDLANASKRYSDDHPDVVQRKRSLEALEIQLKQAQAQNRPYRAPVTEDPAIRQVQEQINAAESDIRAYEQKRSALMARIRETEQNLTRMPAVERDYAMLVHANEQAVERYNAALDKLDEARIAERVETGGAGKRFSLIAAPVVPQDSERPNRTAILMLVLVLGLGAGIITATVVDTLDDTVKSSRELLSISGSPALAVIPFLESDSERRQRLSRNAAAAGLIVASIAIAVLIAKTVGQ